MTAGLPVRTLTHSKVAGHAARKLKEARFDRLPQLQFAPTAEAREAPYVPKGAWTARLDTIQVSWLTVRVTRAAFAQDRRRAARGSVSRLTFNLTLR